MIDACLTALQVPPRGLPGILEPTSCGSFELLQTPGLWGHDPADNSYWNGTAADGDCMPAASRRLLQAIEDVVAHAETLLDIASLEPFASGEFLAAIRRGLGTAARQGRRPTVRVLFGHHGHPRVGYPLQTDADFAAFLADLASGIPIDAGLEVHACRMKTSSTIPTVSWNHAKIVAADGERAIVGGHNLWHDDYLAVAPVHDVSALLEGPLARSAHGFLDHLWRWVGDQVEKPSAGCVAHAVRWAGGRIDRAPPPAAVTLAEPPAGAIPALAVGRLGCGVMADRRIADAGAAVAAMVFRQARHSIRITQMDFGLQYQGVNYWSAPVVAALADVLTDPAKQVEVSLVLSATDATTASGGRYSFGTTVADVVGECKRVIAGRPLTGRMRIAPLRLSAAGDRWVHGGTSLAIANHSKVWIVDDRCLYVGSDNLYPHSLQEFGYLFESEVVAGDLTTAYWNPLWEHSRPAGVDLEDSLQAAGPNTSSRPPEPMPTTAARVERSSSARRPRSPRSSVH